MLGVRCRFDGRDKLMPELGAALEGRRVIAVCPEELGGLGTPRPACNLEGGDGERVLRGAARVIDAAGTDRTTEFVRGAREALARVLEAGANEAVLKDKSPSCGVARVYQGGRVRPGRGVFAALLEKNGIAVRDEHSLQSRGRVRKA